MDLVLDYEAGPLICDFKTSARSSEPMEIAHEIQLSSYAYLFRQVNPWPEAGLEIRSHSSRPRCRRSSSIPYAARTDAHFTRLFAVIREYLDALDAGRFNYRPGFGCAMCDYRRALPKLERNVVIDDRINKSAQLPAAPKGAADGWAFSLAITSSRPMAPMLDGLDQAAFRADSA